MLPASSHDFPRQIPKGTSSSSFAITAWEKRILYCRSCFKAAGHGLVVAGEYGTSLCMAALERPHASEVFAATLRAIEEKSLPYLDRLFAIVETVPESLRGLVSGPALVAGLVGTDVADLRQADLRRPRGVRW